MKIGKYIFKQTCSACPEQYDVFDEEGKQVAYVRLRWGGLSACCPDVGGTYIYSAGIGNDCGCFRTDDERMKHLRKIAERIDQFNYDVRCADCGTKYVLDESNFDEIDDVGKTVFECPGCDRYIVVRDDGDGLFTY